MDDDELFEWKMDICSDCRDNDGDYYFDEDGELMCKCLDCPNNPYLEDD